MTRRQTAGYDLSANAQQIVDAVSERRGMKKTLLVTRVMEWFARQKPSVQTAILDAVDEDMLLVYSEALFAMSRELEQRARKRRQHGG